MRQPLTTLPPLLPLRFQDADHDPPTIRLVVAEGGEDVTIKVSDEGGGIPRSGLPNIWTYLYSTAKSPVEMNEVGGAGRGAGWPACMHACMHAHICLVRFLRSW